LKPSYVGERGSRREDRDSDTGVELDAVDVVMIERGEGSAGKVLMLVPNTEAGSRLDTYMDA
jgi:hypothetical protein